MSALPVLRYSGNAVDAREQIAMRLFEAGFGWEDAAARLVMARGRRIQPNERDAIQATAKRLWREFHHLPIRGRA